MTAPIIPITRAADRAAAQERERAERAKRRAERLAAQRAASLTRAKRDALRAVPTAAVTERGRELARQLARYIGASDTIERTCSLIARLATRHARIAEMVCSVEMSEERAAAVSAEDDRIEARITALVASLPAVKGAPLVVRFGGDPRGFTVKIHIPGDDRAGNNWGGGYGV